MRIVIQRVKSASVEVESEVVGQIKQGLLLLIGVEDADNDEDISWLSKKILNLRIFPDNEKPMNRSVQDINGQLLVVSQFTLYASTKKAIDQVLSKQRLLKKQNVCMKNLLIG